MTELSSTTIWLVIIGLAVTNFALRFTPIAVVSRLRIPAVVNRWLSFVPISVMGALVALEVLRPGGEFVPPFSSPYLWAALLTGVVFRFTHSFLGATLAGMVSFVALSTLLG